MVSIKNKNHVHRVKHVLSCSNNVNQNNDITILVKLFIFNKPEYEIRRTRFEIHNCKTNQWLRWPLCWWLRSNQQLLAVTALNGQSWLFSPQSINKKNYHQYSDWRMQYIAKPKTQQPFSWFCSIEPFKGSYVIHIKQVIKREKTSKGRSLREIFFTAAWQNICSRQGAGQKTCLRQGCRTKNLFKARVPDKMQFGQISSLSIV